VWKDCLVVVIRCRLSVLRCMSVAKSSNNLKPGRCGLGSIYLVWSCVKRWRHLRMGLSKMGLSKIRSYVGNIVGSNVG
jgi:hypothetical protein